MSETYYKSELFEAINQRGLPLHAHGEYNNDVLERAKQTQAIVANLPNQLAAYEASVEAETKASYKELIDSITRRINEELVPYRDSVETGFKAAARAQMESDDPAVAKAGTDLFELAHLHHMHTDMKINEQTDAIRDYIADVEANHMEALTLIGFTTLFNKLKAANDAVCDAVMQRMDIEASRKPGAMAEARQATDDTYRNLLRGIDAYAYLQGKEAYQPFATFLNQLIKYYKSIYPKAGNSSGSSDKEEVTETEKPTDKPTDKPEGGDENDSNNENNGSNNDNNGSNNGNGTGNENNGNQQEEDDPNMPPPGSGGSGFE